MPKQIDKQSKREEILDAAVRVFGRHGFHFTRMVDVAREAGIGKGTIYEYFSSKNDLLSAAFNRYMHMIRQDMETLLAGPHSPVEKIRLIIQHVLDTSAQNPDLILVFFDFWIHSVHDGDQQEINFKTIYAEYRELTRVLLQEGIARGEVRHDVPANTAALFVSAIEGTFLQWIVDPQAFRIADMGKTITDVLLNGIIVPSRTDHSGGENS